MSQLLICGAAGFTNRGDDAILWGMLSQLRARLGARPITVVGGPELNSVVEPFDAAAMGYEDRAQVARAIEDADLVLLGGGGLLYDHDYDPSLARFLTDPPDRQWLYELAKLTAAARAAGKPVMVYGLGVGPLLTESGRRVARFIGESVQAFTVRDQASADVLVECGVSRARVQVTADPAVAVDPAPPAATQALLEQSGIAARPRPWIALNLRPWFRFMGVESSEGGRDRLIAAAADLVKDLTSRLRATLLLLPLQRLYDDDEEVLRRVLEAAGQPEGAVLVDTPARPDEVVSLIGHCDLMIGMRMHSCLLALNAGVPCVSLAYSPKAQEAARLAGLGEYAQPIDALDARAVARACEELLAKREAVREHLRAARARLQTAADVSADMAAWLLEPKGETSRLPVPRAPARPLRGLRVLMQIRPDYRTHPGGDVVQLEAMLPSLAAMGITAELTGEESPDLSGYDLIHTINLDRPEEPYRHCLNALTQDKPIALSTVHTDLTEFLEWGHTDSWLLPEPGEGLPEPRPASLTDPVGIRQRAREHLQRQLIVDWSDSYLPNAQMNAEYLHRTFGLDLTRSVVVPNAVREDFFSATPDLFVSKYGLRDFVLCVGRVEMKKNQLSLVAALRGAGIPLVIVGRGNPPEYLELCRRYADENVHFLDRLREEELVSACAAAKVHALVSWVELPGLTTLEAAAAGCNIVSTDRGSPPEYLQDMAWYCDPRRPESIREAVLAAHAAPKSDRLRERMRALYTWRQAAEATAEGYRVALEVHAGRTAAERQQALSEARRRHYAWLERLAVDRLYELQRTQQWAAEVGNHARRAEAWGRSQETRSEHLERLLSECRGELDRLTSRRSYRLVNAMAGGVWGIMKKLGITR